MAQWDTANISLDALSPIEDALSALGVAASAASRVADVVATLLTVIDTLQSGVDLGAAAINAALSAAIAILDELANSSPGHLLFVPPIAPFRRDPAAPRIPISRLENLAAVRLVRNAAEDLLGDGGNYGLYRKVVESLFDQGDFSRPNYDSDAHVGGAIVLVGSDSFADIIASVLSLATLFDGALALPMDSYQLPVPQNLKTRPIAARRSSWVGQYQVIDTPIPGDEPVTEDTFIPTTSRRALPKYVAAKVKWDPPKVVRFDVFFGPLTYTILAWHVYVKPHRPIEAGEELAAYEVASYSYELGAREGESSQLLAGAQMLGDAAGCVLQKLRPDTTYYISAAYTVEIRDRAADSLTVISPCTETLSGQSRFRGEDRLPYTQFTEGIPPDWQAISSPIAAFPKLQDVLLQTRATLELYKTSLSSRGGALTRAANALREVLSRIEIRQRFLQEKISLLLNTLSSIDAGVWSATFAGQGGVPFIINSLGELLLDPSTENRPPFDRGDEAVSALVFVTGSNSAAEVQAFLSVLSTFFGAPSEGFVTLSDISQGTAPDAVRTVTPGADAAEVGAPNAITPSTDAVPLDLSVLGVGHDPDDC